MLRIIHYIELNVTVIDQAATHNRPEKEVTNKV